MLKGGLEILRSIKWITKPNSSAHPAVARINLTPIDFHLSTAKQWHFYQHYSWSHNFRQGVSPSPPHIVLLQREIVWQSLNSSSMWFIIKGNSLCPKGRWMDSLCWPILIRLEMTFGLSRPSFVLQCNWPKIKALCPEMIKALHLLPRQDECQNRVVLIPG